jgi:hypothetical protein
MIRKHFRLKRVMVGLAFAAIVAPAAQATPYGGTVSNSSSRVDYLSTQVSPYELGSGQATHVLPSGMTLAAPLVARSENSRGAGGPSTVGATNPVAVPVASTASADAFDWSDAAIGALVAFGTALVLLTATMLGRRQHSRLAST